MHPAALLCTLLLSAQLPQATPATPAPRPVVRELQAHPDWPAAKAVDVDTPRDLALAFFSTISAPKGGTLDRARLRSLFLPDGRIALAITIAPPKGSAPGASPRGDVVLLSPDQYADNSDRNTQEAGFFDHLLAAHEERFGDLAHVLTSYESRFNADDPQPFVRGVKVFEMLHANGRWYLTQVSWDRESAANPIPDVYLHDGVQ